MGKFATNASGAMLLLNSIQITESISGSVVPLAMFIPNFTTKDALTVGDDRKSASWQKYLWFSFLKQILSMQVPLWRNTAISSCIEFMDKKFHAHLWESHCKDLFLYEIIMREPLQRFLFIWNNFFLGFWSWHNFLGSYQWMDAGKRKWLSPET